MLSRMELQQVQGACAAGLVQSAPRLAEVMAPLVAEELLRRQTTLEAQLAATNAALAASRAYIEAWLACQAPLEALGALIGDGPAPAVINAACAEIARMRARQRASVEQPAPPAASPAPAAAPKPPAASTLPWSEERRRLLRTDYAVMSPVLMLRRLHALTGRALTWPEVRAEAAALGLSRPVAQPREQEKSDAALKREARELFAADKSAREVDAAIGCGLGAASAWLAEWKAEQAAARAGRAA